MRTIREAKLAEYKDIEAFYRSVGEDVFLHPSERVIVAFEGGCVVGSARLVRDHGVLVLRTVNVALKYQGQGIGSEILRITMCLVGQKKCYCLAYPHLKDFYERFGFRVIEPETLPPFLYERFVEYNKTFLVIAMGKNST